MSVVCNKRVSWASVHVACRCVHSTGVFDITVSATQSLQGVYMRSCVRNLFIRVLDWLWSTGGPSYEGDPPGVAMCGNKRCGCSGCYRLV